VHAPKSLGVVGRVTEHDDGNDVNGDGRDGTGSPGHRVTGSAILAGSGRVGSRINVSDPVFDPVLSFNMRVYRGVVSTELHHLGKLISAVSVSVRFPSQHYWFTCCYFS